MQEQYGELHIETEWLIVWSGQQGTDVPQRTGFSGLMSKFVHQEKRHETGITKGKEKRAWE